MGNKTKPLRKGLSKLIKASMEETRWTQNWFVVMMVLSFVLTLLVPIGCMSAPARYFSLFSVNPGVLALRYNAHLNATGAPLFEEERLVEGLVALGGLGRLPNVYRFGMSGLCREYTNSTEVRCTRSFPQSLNVLSAIRTDIAQKPSTDGSFANALLDLYTTVTTNTTTNTSSSDSLAKASAGLTIISLVVAPVGLAVILALYGFGKTRPGLLVAIVIALVDAGIVVVAASLWITVSWQQVGALEASIQESATTSSSNSATYFHGTPTYPLSIGLLLFSLAAIAKVVVVPVLAVAFLVILPLVFIAVTVVLTVAAFACLCACLGAAGSDDNKTTYTTTETQIVGSDWLPWRYNG